MKLKLFPITLILFFFFNIASAQQAAQKKQYVFFLTDAGKQVSTRDSCDYMRVLTVLDTFFKICDINEYYKNGKPKLVGKAIIAGGPRLEGECVRYYPSGKKQSISHYVAGNLTDELFTFFPNGRLYDEKLLVPYRELDDRYNSGFVVVASNDSTGKELVADSTGHYIDYYGADFKQIKEEGDLKKGEKEGQWSGKYYWTDEKGINTDSAFYSESYEKGKLISGKATLSDKTVIEYKVRITPAEFNGGPDAFNKFLANTLKYPKEDRENNIQGKVYVTFVIEKDGSITNAKAVRGPSESLKTEALRGIQLSPKWKPGIAFGRPARTVYTVPVNFTLSNAY